jgi:Tol biopolymer transport system component
VLVSAGTVFGLLISPALATVNETTLVSRADGAGGAKGNGASFLPDSSTTISADGRYVAFESRASNLDPDDTDTNSDVFVRDLQTGETTTLVSRDDGVSGAKMGGFEPSISADGRYVAFTTYGGDVFVRDLQTSETTLVNRADGVNGAKGDDAQNGRGASGSSNPSISADGRYVAFESYSSNLDPDAPGTDFKDIFVRDLQNSETTFVSRGDGANGVQGNSNSFNPSISADGRYVAFDSAASYFDPDDTARQTFDVFVRDLQNSETTLLSRADGASGAKGNGRSERPSISADGRYVAFESRATNLDPDDAGPDDDVYVRDLQNSETTLVNRGGIALRPSISGDGRYVTYISNGDVYVRDLQNSETTLVNRADGASGAEGDGFSGSPSISADGRYVAFDSSATNLDPYDTDTISDVFVRDVSGAATGTPTCPGYPDDGIADVVGSAGSDTLIATSANQVVCGLGGNDRLGVNQGVAGVTLDGGDGNDLLCGLNSAVTTLEGGSGTDRRRKDKVDRDSGTEAAAAGTSCTGLNP